jgi:very-short-patch-repair endonuclease
VSRELYEKTGGNIELRSKYINAQTKVQFYCNVCHHSFKNKPFNILVGGSGCPVCHESKGERAIRNYLEENNIEFESQKVFPSCRLKLPLPFDFFINKSLLVEFDGPQHYSPNMLMNKREGFQVQKARDDAKTWWALKHDYTLVRIRYDQMELIPRILKNEINRSEVKLGSKQKVQVSRSSCA